MLCTEDPLELHLKLIKANAKDLIQSINHVIMYYMPCVLLSPCLTDCHYYYNLWALHPKVALWSNDPTNYSLIDHLIVP